MKKLLISGKHNDKLISKLTNYLKKFHEISLEIHNPLSDVFNLKNFSDHIKEIDLIIIKIGGESSIDLFYLADQNSIPSINNLNSVLLCKNKIALDFYLRKIFDQYRNEIVSIDLPNSWLHPSPFRNIEKFKEWTSKRLPLVFKSHDQHNEMFRFNFLAQKPEELDKFLIKYKQFLYFDLYVQEFVECDGIDRKIYVVGEKVFGIKRENPIYLYLREKPEDIDVKEIRRETFHVPKNLTKLAHILSKELDLEIFGFDLVKSEEETYYLLDLNDFPGFAGIDRIDEIIGDYILKFLDRKNH